MVYHLKNPQDIRDMLDTDPGMFRDYVRDALMQLRIDRPDSKELYDALIVCKGVSSNEGIEVCLVRNASKISPSLGRESKMSQNERIKMFDKLLEEIDDDVGGSHMVDYNEHLLN